eukprot:14985685-Heterocapsa_arctica.AAC.1
MLAHDGATSTEVTVRITEARRAWISLGRVWFTAAISLALRRNICIALPLAILLSGLDAFALSSTDLMRLERTQVKWFRALLLGGARGKSNSWVRTTVKCPTVASRLSAR